MRPGRFALVSLALFGIAGTWLTTACQAQQEPPTSAKKDAGFSFDQSTAWSHLTKQCDFGPRVPGTEGHKKCRDWMLEQVKASCENARLQPFEYDWQYGKKKVQMWNVIGEQNWKDAKTRVLLIAHWDTRPFASQEPDPKDAEKPILGANDGASGVAVLLELMRAVKGKLPEGLGVMYLLVDGEDLGPDIEEMFLGAKHFAKNLPDAKPDYGILLDMIGDKNLRIPMEPNSLAAAKPLLQAFYRNAATIGLRDTFPQTYGPEILDDHLSLIQAGIPTIDLIDFDYDPWHTLQDVPANCSAESLGKVGKALESWLLRKPVWTYPAGG